MSIAYLLVVIGLAALAGAVWALFWAVDAGQFDDLERQGATILDGDETESDSISVPAEVDVGDLVPVLPLRVTPEE